MARNRDAAFDLLALELASGLTVKDAAAKVGVSESCAQRKLREDPAYRAKVEDLRAGLLAQASGLLVASMTEAVTTLRGLLTAESEMARLGAARSILELAIKVRETVDLSQQIAALQARAAAAEAKR